MTYEDYVYFMLSEEDRGNEHSLRYWFACVDLDGDGRIGHMEMRLFYESQASVTMMKCFSYRIPLGSHFFTSFYRDEVVARCVNGIAVILSDSAFLALACCASSST